MKKKEIILIIEDDKFLLKAYEIKFRQSGIEILIATDGEIGFSIAKEQKPSLIILDLMLPKINGFEVLEKLKSDKDLKNIPVIAVSNLGQESDKTKALNLGAEEYLIKTNYSLEEIIGKIKNYLK